jgi:ADP-ribose pyrophosphatase
MVVPVDDEGKLLLVRQYRYPNDRCSLEFPGGAITGEGGALESAARELTEEAGVTAGKLIPLGGFNPWNGVTSEICSVFLALDLRPCDSPHDPAEECITERHAVEAFDRLAAQGEIWDGQTLAAWTLYRARGGR